MVSGHAFGEMLGCACASGHPAVISDAVVDYGAETVVMSSLGVAAGVTVVVAAGLAAVLTLARRRRRTARPEGPRTVADLVRLRSEAAGRAVDPGSTTDDTAHPTASTATEIGPAATPVAGGPAADETSVDTVSRLGGSGDVAPAAPTPAAGTSAGGNGSGETPWARARLLAGAQDEPVAADNVAARDVPVVPEGSVVRQQPDVRGDLVTPDASAQPELARAR